MSYGLIYKRACEHPSDTAVVYNGNVISYYAFAQAISGTIDFLRTQQISPGKVVVVRVGFIIDCWVVVMALQSLGVRTVCASNEAAIDGLELHDVAGLITTELDLQMRPVTACSTVDRALVIPNPSYGGDSPPREPSQSGTETGGHILYTSGTTGSNKKVFMDAALQEARNEERIEAYRHYGGDRVYHGLGFGLWTAAGYKMPLYIWQMGGAVIFEQRPQLYEHFMASGATSALLTPYQINELLDFLDEHPTVKALRNCKLMATSGFITPEKAEKIRKRVSDYLENAYGATEINVPLLRSVVSQPDDLHWLKPTGYRAVEIVDEEDNACPVGVEGRLRVRCTELDCDHYLDDPEASAKTFRAGYFYPGDMAVQRDDGCIRILGRSADVVNILGQKRAVAPIEQKLQKRLGIDSLCLFSSLPNEGEVEYVIAIESESEPGPLVADTVAGQFAKFGRAQVVSVAEFPRTDTGTQKIDRVTLRKQLFPAS